MAVEQPVEFFGFAAELRARGLACETEPYGTENIYELTGGFPDDIPFYLELARGCGGPVLELGCGTGRVLLPLAAEGFEVTGIDRSPAMLGAARDRLQAAGLKAALHEGDMRDFDLPQRFSLIIIPYCSVIYLLEEEDRRRSLRAVRRHLATGGLLAFDFDTEINRPGITRPWLSTQAVHPLTGELILQTAQRKSLGRDRRLMNLVIYRWRPGEPPRITVQASYEASVSVQSMQALLEEEGFTPRGFYRDYRFSPYNGGHLCVTVAALRE